MKDQNQMLDRNQMVDQKQMPDQQRINLPSDLAPRTSFILLSACVHIAVLALIVALGRITTVRILPEKIQTAQAISGTLPFDSAKSKSIQLPANPLRAPQSKRPARALNPEASADGTSTQALRKRAEQATTAIMADVRFRLIYGFTAGHDYQIAIRQAGETPLIPAADLPPHFQQYVTVEVTVDVDGRVADARIVAGLIPPAVERTLLSAIREFKYSPAKRDGAAIPSQVEIVVRVPS